MVTLFRCPNGKSLSAYRFTGGNAGDYHAMAIGNRAVAHYFFGFQHFPRPTTNGFGYPPVAQAQEFAVDARN